MSRLPCSCQLKSLKYGGSEEKEDGIQYETEIWIYTKSLPIFTSARDKFESSKSNKNGEDTFVNSLVPIFQQWILVAKYQGSTLWMEAYEKDGFLQTDVLDSEPEDIENRCLIGKAKVSIPKMMRLFNNNKLTGKKYSLSDANCQSLIKDILQKLELDIDQQIINDITDVIDDNDTYNNKSKVGPEIWIYAKSVEGMSSMEMDFLRSTQYTSGKMAYIMESLLPVFKHWILVVKFQSTTFWMDANEVDGILQARFLENEPEDIEVLSFFGSVNVSVKELFYFYDENNKKFGGTKYSLKGSNCQTWAIGMLKMLGIGYNLTTINEVVHGTQIGVGLGALGFGVLLLSNFLKR